MTPLAFCSNAFTRIPLAESIDRVAKAGYLGIELLCDRPHYWPGDATASQRRGLKERLDRNGIAVANVNANTAVGYYLGPVPENVFGPSLASPNETLRQQRLSHARGALQLAVAVQAPCISITSGAPSDDHPPEQALDVLHRSLGELLPLAEELDVRIGLEAEPGLLLETSDEVAATIDALEGHPLLGFNLDVGHAHVAGEDPAAVIRRHGARIWHLHLEDIRGRKHFHRIPGTGDIDFAAIAAALDDVRFRGFASVEVYPYKADPDAAALESLAALSSWFSCRPQ